MEGWGRRWWWWWRWNEMYEWKRRRRRRENEWKICMKEYMNEWKEETKAIVVLVAYKETNFPLGRLCRYAIQKKAINQSINQSLHEWMNTYIYPCRMVLSQPKPFFAKQFGSMQTGSLPQPDARTLQSLQSFRLSAYGEPYLYPFLSFPMSARLVLSDINFVRKSCFICYVSGYRPHRFLFV